MATMDPREEPPSGRRYAGATAEERQLDRRRRLLDAALVLYGAPGPAASVERLCSAARVSTSHFYDVYRSRDDLLADLYDELSDRLFEVLMAAAAEAGPTHEEQARAGIGAYVDFVAADEAVARMLLVVPHADSDAIFPHRRATVERTINLILAQADALVAAGQLPARDYRLTAVALTGAGIELLSTWLLTDPRPDVVPVREELIRLHLAAVR